MNVNCIIGIDPGAAGCIAVWRPNYKVTTIRMPKDIDGISTYLTDIRKVSCHPIIFLEKLNVRPDDVLMNSEGVSMGKLYRIQKMLQNFEHLKALITVSGIPFVMVNPMKWQSTLKLRIKVNGVKEEKSVRKRRYRDVAGKLYPEIKPTLWNSDAVLLMHFGRVVLQNDIEWVKNNLPLKSQQGLF